MLNQVKLMHLVAEPWNGFKRITWKVEIKKIHFVGAFNDCFLIVREISIDARFAPRQTSTASIQANRAG